MFYKKNNSKNTDNTFADKFNHKKTIQNDNKRLQNISVKTTSVVKVDITNLNNNVSQVNLDTDSHTNLNTDNSNKNDKSSLLYENGIYTNTIQKSVNIEIYKNYLSDANNTITKIPTIVYKEILIPTYLETDNFDFTTIHKNINSHMEMVFEKKISDANVDILHKKGVKFINNVYQELYKENVKPTGFGDFIRGCYYLLQFCNKNGFQPRVFVYSLIAEFLINHCENYRLHKKYNQGFLSSIPMFVKNNWDDCILDENNYIIDCTKSAHVKEDFIRYLYNDVSVYSNNIFIYNIMFPEDDEITKNDKIYIQKMLQPSVEMSEYVDEMLKLLCFKKNMYSVVHIRSGDKFLCENSKFFARDYLNKIVDEVFNIFNNNNNNNNNNNSCDYLLVADNNEIKVLLMEMYPNLKSLILDITHLGEGVVLERQKVKNTLLDFYLLANSRAIYSFTSYPHGTGFSYWCAKTYEIPYSCKYIKI